MVLPHGLGAVLYMIYLDACAELSIEGGILIAGNSKYAVISPIVNGDRSVDGICKSLAIDVKNGDDNWTKVMPWNDLYATYEEAEAALEVSNAEKI